jgi:hypothetical protein
MYVHWNLNLVLSHLHDVGSAKAIEAAREENQVTHLFNKECSRLRKKYLLHKQHYASTCQETWVGVGGEGGNMIKSVAPGTKPIQWCPTGFTHTKKRRVQRLRASEIREQVAQKKSYDRVIK